MFLPPVFQTRNSLGQWFLLVSEEHSGTECVCVPSRVLCLFPLGQKTLKDFVLQDKELYRTVPSSCLPDKGTLRGSVSFLCL